MSHVQHRRAGQSSGRAIVGEGNILGEKGQIREETSSESRQRRSASIAFDSQLYCKIHGLRATSQQPGSRMPGSATLTAFPAGTQDRFVSHLTETPRTPASESLWRSTPAHGGAARSELGVSDTDAPFRGPLRWSPMVVNVF